MSECEKTISPGKRGPTLWQLNALRGAAALYVFIYHSRIFRNTPMGYLFCAGPEAVMLFFLLSGFVISYSSESRLATEGFRGYFVRRFRRIFPLFIVALGLVYVVRRIVRQDPLILGWRTLLGNLCMLQDMKWLKRGAWVETFGNDAFWSLSYEWWFYMLFFPVSRYLATHTQTVVAICVSVVGAISYQLVPNQIGLFAGYFFVWWCGVELAREFRARGEITWRRQAPHIFMLLLLCGTWGYPVLRAWSGRSPLRISFEPVIEFRHICAGLVFLVLGILWYRLGLRGFQLLVGPFVYIAPFSYALYIFHRPFIVLGWGRSPATVAMLYFCVLFPVCYLLECVVQPRVSRLFDRFLFPRRPIAPSVPEVLAQTSSSHDLASAL
jgi:peptidoglycan/LPS O-acetylase OafA/YrhL